MKDQFNIEDIFKNSFQEHSVEPSSQIWNGIQRKLWVRQLGQFFKMSFEGFKTEPSTQVWNNIAKRLWIYKFLRFSPTSFNIYYSFLALAVLTGSIYFAGSNSTAKTTSNTSENQGLTSEKEKTNAITLANNNPEQRKSETSKNNDSRSESTPQTNNELINNLNNRKDNNQTKAPANNQLKINKKNNTVTDKQKNKQEKFFTQNNKKVNDPSAINPLIAFNNTDKIAANKNSEKNEIILDKGLSNKLILQNILSKRTNLPISVVQSLSLVPDTIGYSIWGLPIVYEAQKWSADVWYSPIYNPAVFNAKNPEFSEYTSLIRNITTPAYTNAFGINLNYIHKNWIFQIGLSVTQLGEKITVPNTQRNINSYNYYNHFDRGFFRNDTIWFLDYDALLHGDSVLIPGIRSQWVVVKDSALLTKTDTLKIKTYHEVFNKYTYIDVPFMFGYEFTRNKFSFDLKAGLATSIFLYAQGKTISLNGENSIDLASDQLPFMKINFSVLFSLGINYNMNKKIAIFGEPYLRRNLNSIYNNTYFLSQKFQTFGVKFGIRYNF